MITEAQIEDDVGARLDDDPRIAASSEIT